MNQTDKLGFGVFPGSTDLCGKPGRVSAGKGQSSSSRVTGAFRSCFLHSLTKGLFSAWHFTSDLRRVESASGRDGLPGREARSEALLLCGQRGQTSLLQGHHSHNPVSLHPPGAMLSLPQRQQPQQVPLPTPWLRRLGPAPRTAPRLSPPYCGDMPPLPSCAAFVLSELWRWCSGLAASALLTATCRNAFGQPVGKRVTSTQQVPLR